MVSTSHAASTPVARTNLTERVASHLAGLIRAGAIAAGARLPTERELCGRYQVSRTVVREAISRLKSEGLVSSRQGSGVFVVAAEGRERPFRIERGEEVSTEEMLRITELRMAFDVEAAVLAARRRTATQLRAIRAALAEMERALVAGELGDEADLAFHRAVAAATGNPLYVSFFAFLEQHLRKAIRRSRERSRRRADTARRVQRQHEEMVDAITARDPTAAAAAARKLVEGTLKRLSREVAGEAPSI